MSEVAGTEFARELFAQRAWLGRLARSLVEDHASAEDLVQETWIAAMRTQPAKDAGLRGWLATVMRNRARSKARDERNRKRREQWASRQEAQPSTGEVVERAAIQQEVADCVMRLREPYREVVLLRFFDELPPREIARKLNVPVGTVKTRLARGLEQLRELLDQTHGGDRSVWMGSIALLFVAPQKSWVWKGAGVASALLFSGGLAWIALKLSDTPEQFVNQVAAQGERLHSERREIIGLTTDPSSSNNGGNEANRVSGRAIGFTPVTESKDGMQPDKILTRFDRDSGILATEQTFPSGLVSMREERVEIGLDDAELQFFEREAFEAIETLRAVGLEELDARDSAPRHTREVPAFKLMNTEVTNEQYLRFIEESGYRAPLEWSFGRTYRNPEGAGVYRSSEGSGWTIPASHLKLPVTNLAFRDAQAFADWMGLRLPTEFEWERAVRGKRGYDYAWDKKGSNWDEESQTSASPFVSTQVLPVGTGRKGSERDAICDLSGNVSEWTASSTEPYSNKRPKKSKRFPAGDPHETCTASGVRGGSFAIPTILAHAGLRQVDYIGARDDLGFRCAASLEPGKDRAAALSRFGSPNYYSLCSTNPPDTSRVLGMDRWIQERMNPNRPGGDGSEFANNVLAGYDVILFAPAQEVAQPTGEPYSHVDVGYFHCDLAIEPSIELPNGTYTVRIVYDGNGNPAIELNGRNGIRHYPSDGVVEFGSKRGRGTIKVSRAGESTVRYVSFLVTIPLPDDRAWRLSWSVPVNPRALEGYWRTKPWSDRKIK